MAFWMLCKKIYRFWLIQSTWLFFKFSSNNIILLFICTQIFLMLLGAQWQGRVILFYIGFGCCKLSEVLDLKKRPILQRNLPTYFKIWYVNFLWNENNTQVVKIVRQWTISFASLPVLISEDDAKPSYILMA